MRAKCVTIFQSSLTWSGKHGGLLLFAKSVIGQVKNEATFSFLHLTVLFICLLFATLDVKVNFVKRFASRSFYNLTWTTCWRNFEINARRKKTPNALRSVVHRFHSFFRLRPDNLDRHCWYDFRFLLSQNAKNLHSKRQHLDRDEWEQDRKTFSYAIAHASY